MRYAVFLYIIFIPFLHALSPVPIQSIPFFLAVLAMPLLLLRRRRYKYEFASQDATFALIILIGVVAWTFYPAPVEKGRIQGALQWSSSILISLIVFRTMVINSELSILDVGKAASFAVIILSGAIVLDFLLSNLYGLFLSDIIPYSVDEFPEATILNSLQRPHGLTVEAGFNGIAYECLLPFVVLRWFRLKDFVSRLALMASAVGMILIVSSATIFALIFAVGLLYLAKRRSFAATLGFVVFVPGFVLLALSNQFLYGLFGYKIADFLLPDQYDVYGSGRQWTFLYGLELLKSNPFGIGWGTVAQEASTPSTVIDLNIAGNSLISLWLELAVATGYIGLVLFARLVYKNCTGLIRMVNPDSGFIFVSLVAVSLHHVFVYDLWFPMFWFSLAMSQVALSAHGAAFLTTERSAPATWGTSHS